MMKFIRSLVNVYLAPIKFRTLYLPMCLYENPLDDDIEVVIGNTAYLDYDVAKSKCQGCTEPFEILEVIL